MVSSSPVLPTFLHRRIRPPSTSSPSASPPSPLLPQNGSASSATPSSPDLFVATSFVYARSRFCWFSRSNWRS